jgi:hypothetical protein
MRTPPPDRESGGLNCRFSADTRVTVRQVARRCHSPSDSGQSVLLQSDVDGGHLPGRAEPHRRGVRKLAAAWIDCVAVAKCRSRSPSALRRILSCDVKDGTHVVLARPEGFQNVLTCAVRHGDKVPTSTPRSSAVRSPVEAPGSPVRCSVPSGRSPSPRSRASDVRQRPARRLSHWGTLMVLLRTPPGHCHRCRLSLRGSPTGSALLEALSGLRHERESHQSREREVSPVPLTPGPSTSLQQLPRTPELVAPSS